jgi:hypothetical protein
MGVTDGLGRCTLEVRCDPSGLGPARMNLGGRGPDGQYGRAGRARHRWCPRIGLAISTRLADRGVTVASATPAAPTRPRRSPPPTRRDDPSGHHRGGDEIAIPTRPDPARAIRLWLLRPLIGMLTRDGVATRLRGMAGGGCEPWEGMVAAGDSSAGMTRATNKLDLRRELRALDGPPGSTAGSEVHDGPGRP